MVTRNKVLLFNCVSITISKFLFLITCNIDIKICFDFKIYKNRMSSPLLKDE